MWFMHIETGQIILVTQVLEDEYGGKWFAEFETGPDAGAILAKSLEEFEYIGVI